MKTLREVADELCPYRLEDYDPAIDDILDECLHDSWIVGFIAGAQWRENNPVSAGSVSDPESDPIELCGLLWDTENLAIGGYEKDGHHYYTWKEAMDAAKSVGKRLPTREELKALCDLGSTWDDELKGRWFGGNHDTDHKGSLFLPAAGFGYSNDLGYCAKLAGTSLTGYYWSSSMDDESDDYADSLHLGSLGVTPLGINLITLCFSVRCVRDKE